MNYKTIAMKFSMSLMLAGLMLGNAALAEENKYFSCKYSNGKEFRREFSEFHAEGGYYIVQGRLTGNGPCASDAYYKDTISRTNGEFRSEALSTTCKLLSEINEAITVGTCELKTEKLKF